MDESTIRLEISNLMYSFGFVCHHPPDMKPIWDRKKTADEKPEEKKDQPKVARVKKDFAGNIDLMCMNPAGESVIIEVKRIVMTDKPRAGHNGALYFSDISTSQRKNLDRWCFGLGGPAYIGIGTIESNEARRLWIVPWEDWVDMENEMISQGHPGIPVYSSKAVGLCNFFGNKEIADKYFECDWQGVSTDVHWSFPLTHPIWRVRKLGTRPSIENEFKIVSSRFDK